MAENAEGSLRLSPLRDGVTPRGVFSSRRNVVSAAVRRNRGGSTTLVAGPRIVCSVGPPTVSDTVSPPDDHNVGGDYVLILTHYHLPTERENRNLTAQRPRRLGFRAPSRLFWRCGGRSCRAHLRM